MMGRTTLLIILHGSKQPVLYFTVAGMVVVVVIQPGQGKPPTVR